MVTVTVSSDRATSHPIDPQVVDPTRNDLAAAAWASPAAASGLRDKVMERAAECATPSTSARLDWTRPTTITAASSIVKIGARITSSTAADPRSPETRLMASPVRRGRPP